MSVSLRIPNHNNNDHRQHLHAPGDGAATRNVRCPIPQLLFSSLWTSCGVGGKKLIHGCSESVVDRDHIDDNDKYDIDETNQRLHYEKLLAVHKILVDRKMEANNLTIVPFAERCQQKYKLLGGYPIRFVSGTSSRSRGAAVVAASSSSPGIKVDREFVLPTSPSKNRVVVLDNVLPASWCNDMIQFNERIGYGTVPSIREARESQRRTASSGTNAVGSSVQHVSVSQPKNTSKLVQLELPNFAAYLWNHLEQFLPLYQYDVPTKGLIKVFDEASNVSDSGAPRIVYEKRNIIPTFRFMKYTTGQGFLVHEDPERVHYRYPCNDTVTISRKRTATRADDDRDDNDENLETSMAGNVTYTKEGDTGIFRSLFTIAIYLNDSREFNGGQLNFVQRKYTHNPLLVLQHQNEGVESDKIDPNEDTQNQHNISSSFDILESVLPKIGRCVIFRHDELHEGGGIHDGSVASAAAGTGTADGGREEGRTGNAKYMLQCDVLYERVIM